MKKEILFMGALTVIGCWGVHAGKTHMEICEFDKKMKEWKHIQKNEESSKNMIP